MTSLSLLAGRTVDCCILQLHVTQYYINQQSGISHSTLRGYFNGTALLVLHHSNLDCCSLLGDHAMFTLAII